MMLGGLGDGCGELRAGLRQPSGIPRLLCGLLRPQAVAGSQRELPSALLGQDQERRNAENLSESVGISARAMQRFLTEARWSDETVIGRLQEYLAPRLGHPEAVWVFDGSDFPKQGRKSAGVARQYCGRLGKVANCQGGMFLAYVSPLGRALVDKRLYLPKSWTSTRTGVLRREFRRTGGTTGQRRSWPWSCWSGSWSWATSGPSGLPETTPSGCRRPSGRDWRPWGCATWTFRAALRSGPWSRLGPVRNTGVRAPPQTQAAAWAAADHGAARDELPEEACR